MEVLTGIIQADGTVLAEDGTVQYLDSRGTDEEGYIEVLIDAKEVGGSGSWARQSIKPYIGMCVEFVRYDKKHQGYNFTILKHK